MHRYHRRTVTLVASLFFLALITLPFQILSGNREGGIPGGALIVNAPLEVHAKAASGPALQVSAKSAILIDAGSGQVLYEWNSHEKLPPASVTKVMTMLLAMEAIQRGQIALTDPVTISDRAASMGGSQMFMEAGEIQTLETLLMGMAVCSANDACVATAEHVSGTEEIFVEQMNQRAAELGMIDTHFVNTNGLPVADHVTSAYDIAVMSRALMKFDKPREWFHIWMTDVTVGLEGKEKTKLGITNTNRLIKTYPGANGIKTGFTQDAGYCLSASATRGDLTLISVIMGSQDSKTRFAEAARLLDYGFAQYDSVNLGKQGDSFGKILVEKGDPQQIDAVCKEPVSILVKKGQREEITSKVELDPVIHAPLASDSQVGELVVYQKEKEVQRVPLFASAEVKKASYPQLYLRMLNSLVK